jgi:hypothetical protein
MLFRSISLFLLATLPALASAETSLPKCERSGFGHVYGTSSILKFKNQNEESFSAEAYIRGEFVQYIPSDEWPRFELKIGPRAQDKVVITYSPYAQPLPAFRKGEPMMVCGRFRTLDGGGSVEDTYLDLAAYPGHGDGFIFVHGHKYE